MSISTHGADGDSVIRPAKRSRVLVACRRCKGRRQKCDNAAPACSNCARSNATCTYPHYPTTYVHQLEERVGLLEARLRRVDPQQASDDVSNNAPDGLPPQVDTPSSMPSQQSRLATSSSGHLASGIGLLSSCAAAEPHYFGFSSGLTLAHFVEAAIAPRHGASDINLPSLADRPFSKQVPTAQTPLAPVPTYATGNKFIKAYLSNIHALYPFMDEDDLWRIHRNATGEAQSPLDLQTRTDLTRLHLIYAIGSRCVQLLRPRNIEKHLPEGHLMTAMQHIPEVLKFTSIHAPEITLLLAIHSMRSPSGASVWHLCGCAMRQCLELGLHRSKPIQPSQASLEQQRRKLFWSVYIFERKSALVLGRPFAISDKDIEVPIPGEPNGGAAASLALHCHYIFLYQIHSKIRSTLHRLKQGASDNKVRDKVAACLQRLENWKDSVQQEIAARSQAGDSTARGLSQSDSSESENDIPTLSVVRSATIDRIELLLEYYKARRSLLQPLLTEAGQYSPSLSDYAACADASGQICQHYRQLHRLSALPFTLRDLYAVVVAGFTSVYCVMARPGLYSARRASEIGACSMVLYVIAEQWKSARRYRDAFEAVADKLVDLVAQQEQQPPRRPNARGKAPRSASQASSNSLSTSAMPRSAIEKTQKAGMEGFPGSLDGADDGEIDGLFSNFFDDSFAHFDINYSDEGLRGLLVNEGLDWFRALDDNGSR